ncbi:MAG: hypothetical protein M1835_002317 [Candelina submexicana]|nr:MAG: hypothetical protein M1835_002317 [Candelina submexicana]
MAEAAGLAIGVVGVVGFLGQIFDGCIKAYSIFTKASNLGRDSERLLCKIRIEEMRLMVWGKAWGVVEGRLEAHLASDEGGGNEGLKKLAEMILKQLYETITDFNKLQDRYGLREDTSSGVAEKGKVPDPPGMVTSRLRDELKLSDLKLRAKWVISDKDKFELLLKDLKDFNDGLERLLPPARIATLQRTWTNELLQTASRDVGQLGLLESASSGVYPNLNTFARLKQLRINLDAEETPKKFMSSSGLKLPKVALSYPTVDEANRILGSYRNPTSSTPEAVIIEWITYEPEMELDTRLTLYQRVDNIARMAHSAANRHPDLHTLDCLGYFDDKTRYGLVYRLPSPLHSQNPTSPKAFQTLSSLIDDSNTRTPDLDQRFHLAKTLAIALWSLHSLDWLHKSFCGHNILFLDTPPSPSVPQPTDTPSITTPYILGFDTSRPDHLSEMTVASRNSNNQDLYRHPSSLGVWRQPYRKSFDIYSLGLAMLEIGLWKSLKGFHKPKYSPATFRDKVVLGVLVPGLGSKTGGVYRRLVERCLVFEEGGEGKESSRFMEGVVLTLEGLRV